MSYFPSFDSRVVPLLINDVDTDQIIPARFLKATDKSGMGDNLFADWRYNADGSPKPDFALNMPEHQGAQVLLAGDNFGCGSSREHAPWALRGFGFKAIISTSFADIFKGNSLKNGLLPIQVDSAMHKELVDLFSKAPDVTLTIDLEQQSVSLPGGKNITFPIDGFSKYCLLNGVDELGYLQRFDKKIKEYELTHS